MSLFYPALCALASAAILATLVQAVLGDGSPGSVGRHAILGILTTIFVSFVHSILMSWMLGLGKSQKTAILEFALDPELMREMRRIKSRGFPMATFAPLALIAAGLIGGGVQAGSISPLWHQVAVAVAALMNLLAFPGQVRVVRDNERLMRRVEEEVDRAMWMSRRSPPPPDGANLVETEGTGPIRQGQAESPNAAGVASGGGPSPEGAAGSADGEESTGAGQQPPGAAGSADGKESTGAGQQPPGIAGSADGEESPGSGRQPPGIAGAGPAAEASGTSTQSPSGRASTP